jgi:hypothetical protein
VRWIQCAKGENLDPTTQQKCIGLGVTFPMAMLDHTMTSCAQQYPDNPGVILLVQ